MIAPIAFLTMELTRHVIINTDACRDTACCVPTSDCVGDGAARVRKNPYSVARVARTIIVAIIFAASISRAQVNRNVQWTLLTPSIQARPGAVVNIKLQATIAEHSHMYSLKTYASGTQGPAPTEVTVGDKPLLARVGGITPDHPATVKFDENFDLTTEYFDGTVVLSIPVRIAKSARLGTNNGWVNVRFMSCDDNACMPPTDVRFPVSVLAQRVPRRKPV